MDALLRLIEDEIGQKVLPETELDTLGDSLEFMNLLLRIDNELGIEITPEKLGDLRTVGDLLSVSC